MLLEDSIEIKTTPERIFEFLAHLEDNYRAWHSDHVECRRIKGEEAQEGSVLYIEEYLHGQLHKMTFRMKNVEPTQFEYDVLFPHAIISPNGSFRIYPKGESCIFTASITFRLGALSKFLFKDRVQAIRIHMKEEGENLKQLLETGAGKS
ncbi:MAG: SRPBCC family protein [Theionarchaea archaeon]|nr:SRPBCC family protein [Theionarchaea archaeon]MBU7037476.1 SRPBCC family protein [Theionarchaea archaeon]